LRRLMSPGVAASRQSAAELLPEKCGILTKCRHRGWYMRPNLAAPRREDVGQKPLAEAGGCAEIAALSWCRRISRRRVCL